MASNNASTPTSPCGTCDTRLDASHDTQAASNNASAPTSPRVDPAGLHAHPRPIDIDQVVPEESGRLTTSGGGAWGVDGMCNLGNVVHLCPGRWDSGLEVPSESHIHSASGAGMRAVGGMHDLTHMPHLRVHGPDACNSHQDLNILLLNVHHKLESVSACSGGMRCEDGTCDLTDM